MNNMNDDFLSLLNPNLDNYQKEALRVPENAVIAAGAGSGKTQVLATRYAWLIMTEQATVDQILTLTFTNKAASEMYQRIYKTLTFFSEHEVCNELSEKQIELAKKALNDFAAAHIQTLDSYCGSVVRQACNRYGIKPDFSTGSSDSKRDIKDKAFKFVLRNKERKGIQTFSDNGKLQEFSEDIFASTIERYTSLATEEGYFTKKLAIQRKELIDAWNYYVISIPNEKYMFDSKLKNIQTHLEDIMAEKNATKESILCDTKKIPFLTALDKIFEAYYQKDSWPCLSEEDILDEEKRKTLHEKFKIIDDFFELVSKAYYTANAIQKVKTKLGKLLDAKNECFASIMEYIKQYDSIVDLYSLFDDFLLEVNASKRVSGNLTFNDVGELSLKVLLENEDIRNQEKESFTKIMIDEFQDNNGKNRDFLYLLSLKKGAFESEEGNCIISVDENNSLVSQIVIRDENGKIVEDKRCKDKLFFVGDEKQSIYKFRGAEVSVFNELTKDKENLLVPMTYNYRSSEELIKSFNLLFQGGKGVFEEESLIKDYEAYYKNEAEKNYGKDTVKTLPKLTQDNVPIHIKLLSITEANKLSKTEDLAPNKEVVIYNMVKQIYEMGKEKKEWKKFAILDKSRTDRDLIAKYLGFFNIPYELDQFNDIFEDGIINDFYNFFRLCVYPSDKSAFSVYLTCPLSGLSIISLEIILSHLNNYADKENVEFVPYPEDEKLLESIKNDIPESEYEKYLASKSFFNEYRSKTLQQQITTTLTTLWHTKGYKYESLINDQTELCAEHFDMIFEMGRLADNDGKSVSWFVDQLNLLKNKYSEKNADIDAKGVTYPIERKDAVQVMTIHKSKGLQFDHVFIYDITAYESKGEKSKIFFDEEYGVSIKPENDTKNYFFIKGKDLSTKKEVAEFRRVIYVAVTRAIKDVYIYGSWYPVPSDKNKEYPFRLIETAIVNSYTASPKDQVNFKEEAGFDFEAIDPITYKELPSIKEGKAIDVIREEKIIIADKAFENAKIINFEAHPIPRNTPSGLEKEKNVVSDADTADKYNESEDILLTASFEAKDFGTLVHSYLEAQCNGIDAEKYEPKPSLFKNLKDNDIKQNKDICIKMCKEFKESKLGQGLEKAKANNDFYRAEWGFRMWYMESIFTGSIDLIYSNGDGTYTIVDYKSDKEIDPNYYLAQQHAYQEAASRLLDVDKSKIKLYLYYLKHKEIRKLD